MEQNNNLSKTFKPKKLIVLTVISTILFIVGVIFGIESLIIKNNPNNDLSALVIIFYLPLFMIFTATTAILNITTIILTIKGMHSNKKISLACLIFNILLLVANIVILVCLLI
jgi:uncharacterized membrane protein